MDVVTALLQWQLQILGSLQTTTMTRGTFLQQGPSAQFSFDTTFTAFNQRSHDYFSRSSGTVWAGCQLKSCEPGT